MAQDKNFSKVRYFDSDILIWNTKGPAGTALLNRHNRKPGHLDLSGLQRYILAVGNCTNRARGLPHLY
jgi:hypothetical protein